ncbi:MAG TPA: D-alanyl-D-alanine carboxypeptidase [Lachnospiraceae bacterium]|nr:D-alanyl-D-alanine carboxypeptidase [Lachnospiraceae bacterium]
MLRNRLNFTLLMLIIFILQITITTNAQPVDSTFEVASPSAILINAKTGQILFEKNIHERMYPASITKIMTATLALEKGNLQSKVIMSHHAVYDIEPGSSNVGLMEGEEVTLAQLLFCLLLNSGNEAANAIAETIGGSEENFAKIMTQRAKELGAKDTNFVNPNGLPNPNHYTTAYDMSLIAKHAMKLPAFREIINTKNFTLPPTNKNPREKELYNSNKLLGNSKYYYPYAIGVKTGYTTIAGSTFVGAANKDDIELIAVVLNSPIEGYNSYMYLDTIKMFNHGFDNFEVYKSFDKNHILETLKISGGNKALRAVPQDDLNILIPKGTNIKDIIITTKINENLTAPVKKGEIIGFLSIAEKGRSLQRVNIIANNGVGKSIFAGLSIPKQKSFPSILWFVIKWILLVITLAVLILIIAAIVYDKYSNHKRRKSKSFLK